MIKILLEIIYRVYFMPRHLLNLLTPNSLPLTENNVYGFQASGCKFINKDPEYPANDYVGTNGRYMDVQEDAFAAKVLEDHYSNEFNQLTTQQQDVLLREVFLETEELVEQAFPEPAKNHGCTAVVCAVTHQVTENGVQNVAIKTSWMGDSMVAWVTRNSLTKEVKDLVFLNQPHNLSREAARVKHLFTKYFPDQPTETLFASGRLKGSLAVMRSIAATKFEYGGKKPDGNYEGFHEPEQKTFVTESFKPDEEYFLLIFSDGLTEGIYADTKTSLIASLNLYKHIPIEELPQKLVEDALVNRSTDNTSVLIQYFSPLKEPEYTYQTSILKVADGHGSYPSYMQRPINSYPKQIADYVVDCFFKVLLKKLELFMLLRDRNALCGKIIIGLGEYLKLKTNQSTLFGARGTRRAKWYQSFFQNIQDPKDHLIVFCALLKSEFGGDLKQCVLKEFLHEVGKNAVDLQMRQQLQEKSLFILQQNERNSSAIIDLIDGVAQQAKNANGQVEIQPMVPSCGWS